MNEEKDPCWSTHKMVGMKKKPGYPGMVPNCVPKEKTNPRIPRKKGQPANSKKLSLIHI